MPTAPHVRFAGCRRWGKTFAVCHCFTQGEHLLQLVGTLFIQGNLGATIPLSPRPVVQIDGWCVIFQCTQISRNQHTGPEIFQTLFRQQDFGFALEQNFGVGKATLCGVGAPSRPKWFELISFEDWCLTTAPVQDLNSRCETTKCVSSGHTLFCCVQAFMLQVCDKTVDSVIAGYVCTWVNSAIRSLQRVRVSTSRLLDKTL